MARNINKEVAKILQDGTPKQKAVIICKNFIDKQAQKNNTLLTRDEVEAIRNSISTPEEMKEYNKWLSIFNTYTRLAPTFGLVYAEYRADANGLMMQLRQWECYSREEDHLNSILDELKETNNEEGVKSFYDTLKHINLPMAEITLDNDGYIKINIGKPDDDLSTLMGQIFYGREKVRSGMAVMKAMIKAVEEWTTKMKSKAIMPPLMEDAIKKVKADFALVIAPTYSERELNKRIAKGEKIRPNERLRAIFPDYETIEVAEEFYESFKNKIEDIYQNEK